MSEKDELYKPIERHELTALASTSYAERVAGLSPTDRAELSFSNLGAIMATLLDLRDRVCLLQDVVEEFRAANGADERVIERLTKIETALKTIEKKEYPLMEIRAPANMTQEQARRLYEAIRAGLPESFAVSFPSLEYLRAASEDAALNIGAESVVESPAGASASWAEVELTVGGERMYGIGSIDYGPSDPVNR